MQGKAQRKIAKGAGLQTPLWDHKFPYEPATTMERMALFSDTKHLSPDTDGVPLVPSGNSPCDEIVQYAPAITMRRMRRLPDTKKTSPDTDGVALPIWNAPLILLSSQPSLPTRPEPNGVVNVTPKRPSPKVMFIAPGSRTAFHRLDLTACSSTQLPEAGEIAEHPRRYTCVQYGPATDTLQMLHLSDTNTFSPATKCVACCISQRPRPGVPCHEIARMNVVCPHKYCPKVEAKP